jgi:hypothetical protein
MTIKSGLLIRPQWIELILRGQKIWEMRSRRTHIRGKIGLIRQGSGLVLGTASLIDCRPALTRDDYMRYRDKHAIPESMLDEVMAKRWVFPWVLSDVRPLPKPVPYLHGSGPVTFISLEPSVIAAIAMQNYDPAPAIPTEPTQLAPISPSMPPPEARPASVATRVASWSPSSGVERLFVYNPETAQAYGRPLQGKEFIVLAGSTAMRNGSASVKRDRRERDRLVRDGVLIADNDPRLFRFARDHVFSSPSQAAGVVKDGNASGPSLWKAVTTG